MQQKTFTAILLRATDYHESDKLARLLTPEDGKINAVLKGVKKQNAKLKFAAQPFAFCQYECVSGKGGYYTVTGASMLGDFYCLASSENYMLASLLLEAADSASYGISSPKAFVLLLEGLKTLAYSNANSRLVAAQFLLKLVDLAGYKAQYIYDGSQAIKTVSDVCASLQNLPPEEIEKMIVTNELARKTLKTQIARFSEKIEIPLKTAEFID